MREVDILGIQEELLLDKFNTLCFLMTEVDILGIREVFLGDFHLYGFNI